MRRKGLILMAAAFFLATAANAAYEYAGKWGRNGSGDGRFSFPEGVAFVSSGVIYVADTGNNRIQYFTQSGWFLGKWGSPGTGDGQFGLPSSVAVGTGPFSGYIYVADTNNHRIQYFTSTGSFLGKWGAEGTGDGQFNFPAGVTVTRDGAYVYVADTRNNRIQYFYDGYVGVVPASLGRVKALFK